MDPIEQRIADGLRATAPVLRADARAGILTAAARRPAARPLGFGARTALAAACLALLQIVVVGHLDRQANALIAGPTPSARSQAIARSSEVSVVRAIVERARMLAALLTDHDAPATHADRRNDNVRYA